MEFLHAVPADARVRLAWEVRAARERRGGAGQVLELAGQLTDGSGRVCVSATGRLLVGPAGG